MHDFDQRSGVIIFSQIGKNGLSCWNTAMPLSPANTALIVQDNKLMVYPSDLSVSPSLKIFVENFVTSIDL